MEIFRLRQCYVGKTKVRGLFLFLRDTYFWVLFLTFSLLLKLSLFLFRNLILLKLKRRIVPNRDENSTNILILWRLSNLRPCFYGFIISGATRSIQDISSSVRRERLEVNTDIRNYRNISLIFSKHYCRQWLQTVSWRQFWTEGKNSNIRNY